jgi:DNA invertase Pin-like site-specific DNA recombinase
LTFYAPQKSSGYINNDKGRSTVLPQFKKNIYTREMIDFIIELVETKRKAKNEIIKEYRIPKTTLYQWLAKYKTSE